MKRSEENMARIYVCLLLFIIFTSPAAAQDAAFPVYCGDLPEPDCTLLEDAYQRLFDLQSGSFDLQFRTWYEQPGNPVDGQTFMLAARGSFTDFDASGFVPTADIAADWLNRFRSFKGDAVMTITQPGPAASPDTPVTSLTWAAYLRVIDGQVYVDLDSLQPLLGNGYSGWGMYPLDLTPRVQPTPDSPYVVTLPLVLGLDAGQLLSEFEPEMVRPYLMVVRAADEEGQAVFHTTVHIPNLYADPVFRERLRERLGHYRQHVRVTPSGLRDAPTDEELDRVAQQMSLLFPEPLHLRSQFVDLETGILSGEYTWNMSGEMSDMIDAITGGGQIITWGKTLGEFTLRIADFNQPQTISVPETFTLLDNDTVIQIPALGFLPVVYTVDSGE
jgi:hypothetical protein